MILHCRLSGFYELWKIKDFNLGFRLKIRFCTSFDISIFNDMKETNKDHQINSAYVLCGSPWFYDIYFEISLAYIYVFIFVNLDCGVCNCLRTTRTMNKRNYGVRSS